ncbi:MAG: hypothetical protein EA385_01915 [Salinarimonadaceae bacterium]|nr:MAG: hypothetical protein EA385_01915 [Salinarimonadaceae bacterium]
MAYLSLVFAFVFQRAFLRIDIASAVVSALAPGVFFLWGYEMDPTGITLSVWLLAAIGVAFAIRVVCAPYFIWRRDQKRIAELQAEIDEPREKRRREMKNRLIDARMAVLNFITDHKIEEHVEDYSISRLSDHRAIRSPIRLVRAEDDSITEVLDSIETHYNRIITLLRIQLLSTDETEKEKAASYIGEERKKYAAAYDALVRCMLD